MRPDPPVPAAPTTVHALSRNRELRRLEAASLLWNAGEQVYLVGLLVYAFSVGGTGYVALVGILQTLPVAALLPVLLRLTGSAPPSLLLRVLLLVRTLAVGGAAVTLTAAGPPVAVFLLAAVDALAASLVRPTRSALVPRIARSPDELVTANVSISTGRGLAALVGPAAAALLLATRDVTATFWLAAGLFGIALALSLGVRGAALLPRIRPVHEGHDSGLAVLRHEPHPRVIVLVLAGQQLVRGMLPVLVVSLAVGVLGAGDQAVGILNSAIGLGALVGSGLAIAILRRVALPAAFAGAVLAWGATLVIPGLIPLLVPAAIALALGGAGKAVIEVTGITLLQRSVPTNHRASVFGILESVVTISVAAGSLLAAILVSALGPAGALVVAGILPVLLIVAAWPALRSADESTAASGQDIHLLGHVPMLRPLALCTIEELAASIRRVGFDAGDVVIRQGDAGDCFYIIEAGLLEAVVDGRPVRSLRPGDSFGEIALLRDVPRTATVRALEPSVVVAMDRDHFLAAVTGRPEASAAAEQVIRGRLGA